jgi:uncharacterized protein (TIGR03435 family)
VKSFLLLIAAVFVASGQAPKFEVASVKRTDRCFSGPSSLDPGSVTLKGVPLRAVLVEAFKVPGDQIDGPSWMDSDCYEISAKYPAGVSKDQLPAMLQGLLSERFKLAARKEDRAKAGYVLVVDKGGLKAKVDDPKEDFMGKNARPGLTFYGVSTKGALKGVMTMGRLASNLSKEGYGPVQDLTGLSGEYDISLTWTRDNAAGPRAGDATASAATAPGTDMPAPEPSLFAAIRESLGLKMERRSVQVPFVVVEHIERVPTEN